MYWHCGKPQMVGQTESRCMGRMIRQADFDFDFDQDGYVWEVYKCGFDACGRVAYNLHEGHDTYVIPVEELATVSACRSTESPSQTNESLTPPTRTTQPWWQQMAAAVASSAWNRFEAVRQ